MPERPTLAARLGTIAAMVRARVPGLDHGIRTQQRITAVNGSVQAGGVTYYGFLSFFPILALAFFVVGYISRVWPEAQENLEVVINEALPGLVGEGSGQISLQTIEDNATTVGIIGLIGVTYAGLGWLSALRTALMAVFDRPQTAGPNFVLAKLLDLLTLALLGLALLVSVSLSSLVAGFSEDLLDWLHWPGRSTTLLALVSVVVGIAVSTALFWGLYVLLARPGLPTRALIGGAIVAAVGFEALKWASTFLLQLTRQQEAFQVFGIALILLVWINYLSRVILYGAAWAATSDPVGAADVASESAEPSESADARALRERVEQARRDPVPPAARVSDEPAAQVATRGATAKAFVGGAGIGALVTYVVGRRQRDH